MKVIETRGYFDPTKCDVYPADPELPWQRFRQSRDGTSRYYVRLTLRALGVIGTRDDSRTVCVGYARTSDLAQLIEW
jgi:hypothetical protein